nr:Dethiobiotin synthetase [Leptolyngbya sp. FACHB-36]
MAAEPDDLLCRLRQKVPPIPGQITTILLALKVVDDRLQSATEIERELACSLYLLASESRQQFDLGRRSGVAWPPLLDEDLGRIAAGVRQIFLGTRQTAAMGGAIQPLA